MLNKKKNYFTEAQLQAAIDNGNSCLYSVYPNYVEPGNINFIFTKAQSYWANICQSTGKAIGKHKDFVIRIGSLFNLISDEDLRIHRLNECMIHELIHTIPGCNNHGRKFKQLASRINLKYPKYNIQTQTGVENYGITIAEQPKKYKIVCSHCGKTYYYTKKPKYSINEYQCSICKSDKLKLIKIL